jgi:DNA-binding response OmpR family regulator
MGFVDIKVMDLPKNKILLLGSTPGPLGDLREFLAKTYQIETANSVQMAEFLVDEWEPQICLLEDTEEFMKWLPRLRGHKGFHIGIVAYACGFGHNEEKALAQGCDHWLLWEGRPDRLHWRIQSLLRANQTRKPAGSPDAKENETHSEALSLDHLKIYPQDFLIKRMGAVVNISPTQFKLLNAFLSHPDQLLSRDWIKTHVWNDSEISLRSIDAHISKLRKALPELDQYLMNIYGKGYIFSRSRQEAA